MASSSDIEIEEEFKDVLLKQTTKDVNPLFHQTYIDEIQKLITSLTSSCSYSFDHLRYIDMNTIIQVIEKYFEVEKLEPTDNFYVQRSELTLPDYRDYETLILEIINSDDIQVTEFDINTIHERLLDSFGVPQMRKKQLY